MKRASRRKYHYFYKTICIITNKFYYGMHSTDNLDDEYVGSGTRLWYSINKHGKENHICEKLEFFESREKLKEKEIQIIDDDMIKDPLCMNLMKGGNGGFISNEQQLRRAKAANIAKLEKMKNNIEYYEKIKLSSRLALEKRIKNGEKFRGSGFLGKKHKKEAKKKIGKSNSISQKGEKNSQYGTHWITNGKENKKIKNNLIPIGWKLGRNGDVVKIG